MIRRLMAAALVFSTSAWAQPVDPAATPVAVAASETAAATPPETAPSAEAPSAPAIPTDPMELLAHALAQTREQAQCRFAFTRLQTTAAQVAWSGADAEATIHFDPRLPIGQRWTVQAQRQQRAIQRALERQDRSGLPFDLITLTVQGEWTFENLALKSEQDDRFVYSYTPRVIPERSADETGAGIIHQLIGEVEVSRETGRVMSSTLREPPDNAVRALGIVRVQRALLRTAYAPGPNGLIVSDSGSQMLSMSALLSQTEVTTSFRFTEVEAICDPAEVARIAEAEAAAQAAARR